MELTFSGKNAENHSFGVEILQILTKKDNFLHLEAIFSIVVEYLENVIVFKQIK